MGASSVRAANHTPRHPRCELSFSNYPFCPLERSLSEEEERCDQEDSLFERAGMRALAASNSSISLSLTFILANTF